MVAIPHIPAFPLHPQMRTSDGCYGYGACGGWKEIWIHMIELNAQSVLQHKEECRGFKLAFHQLTPKELVGGYEMYVDISGYYMDSMVVIANSDLTHC